jgi:simple sugar transport system ATP-binding protein
MTTPQDDIPAGKHHAPADEIGTATPGDRTEPRHGGGIATQTAPLVRLNKAGKRYGAVIALSDITMEVGAGEVTCVLGDNGAGKSTLIKIIAGLHQPSSGTYEVEGVPVSFTSPREALERGIATVYQDLAVVPLMPVWRNFFLGNEVRRGPFLNIPFMRKTCKEELLAMGIDLRDVDQPIGTLSGGERQCVAISRAVHFGAKVLILDEPTAALGVKQSGVVLKYIIQARERGLGVVFITHNPHHAYPVGDRFLLLNRGKSLGYYEKTEITREELTGLMAGGAELEALSHELEGAGGEAAAIGQQIEEEAVELGIAHHPTTDSAATTVNSADRPGGAT